MQQNNIATLNTECFNAIHEGNFDKFKEVIEQGADINATDKYGRTLLYFTGQCKLPQFAEYLLNKQGIDVNKSNDSQESPLAMFIESKMTKIVDILLERKDIDIDSANRSGYTPLHNATIHAPGVAITLIKKGANLNIENINKDTALSLAISKYREPGGKTEERLKLIKLLIVKGAKLSQSCEHYKGWLSALTGKDFDTFCKEAIIEDIKEQIKTKINTILTAPNKASLNNSQLSSNDMQLVYSYLNTTDINKMSRLSTKTSLDTLKFKIERLSKVANIPDLLFNDKDLQEKIKYLRQNCDNVTIEFNTNVCGLMKIQPIPVGDKVAFMYPDHSKIKDELDKCAGEMINLEQKINQQHLPQNQEEQKVEPKIELQDLHDREESKDTNLNLGFTTPKVKKEEKEKQYQKGEKTESRFCSIF